MVDISLIIDVINVLSYVYKISIFGLTISFFNLNLLSFKLLEFLN